MRTQFASLIDNDITETPLTIAVSAPCGGGKTSVAKMVRWRLAERTASRGRDRPVILFADMDTVAAARGPISITGRRRR
jgi:hypothetical protein